MKAKLETTGTILKIIMVDYGLNIPKLAELVKISVPILHNIIADRTAISPSIALRFSKLFGTNPEYWLNLRNKDQMAKCAADSKFMAELKTITKAIKPVPGQNPSAPKTVSKKLPKSPAKSTAIKPVKNPVKKPTAKTSKKIITTNIKQPEINPVIPEIIIEQTPPKPQIKKRYKKKTAK
ncbi:MAG: hypothetical protein LBR98_08300 [Syntrophomonadaceae bacterium]|jgi:addiction module HigA family antidote|nr:hypothetical protein [Syntrophomonadaceae bacterium]